MAVAVANGIWKSLKSMLSALLSLYKCSTHDEKLYGGRHPLDITRHGDDPFSYKNTWGMLQLQEEQRKLQRKLRLKIF